ncbi:DUF2087 domain-containing protein [Pseudobacteroides cellulosolvens]|uniref:DUF2087 domain-containing protein n=1 Tax=Pseudobacteroides cellulosolvens ATCC 35603 = DSM 2933 TaxID=398512 RepID=A0A0L6JW69_9FIRM|nr:DUF2087 domain-containing protein [Pseudobacteroides cellulosolvens]KNY29974.1 Protein of unknown function DUF2087 [Pseudobacteroides cellulosolvens ATCC 35603 = DSM 2933]
MGGNERLFNSSISDMKRGYSDEVDEYVCLICGESVQKGVIYPKDNVLYEAEKYMKLHIESTHGSIFEYLTDMDKSLSGLSHHQSKLLKLFYQDMSDEEIKNEMGIGSSSTIRNHRFVLREKERQAKIFLVLMDLLREGSNKNYKNVKRRISDVACSKRSEVTREEKDKIIERYFPEGVYGPLKAIDMREKNRIVVLEQLVNRFEQDKLYSEKEVNEILKEAFPDFVTLRRYLIEYGFMDRKQNGSQYWVRKYDHGTEGLNLERKKELKNQYKEIKTEAGIYQIRNVENGKVFLVVTPNLKTINGRQIELNTGVYRNKLLQEDWNKYGKDAFVFEVLEVLEQPEEGYFDMKDELKKLENKWLEKLQPYGDKGYHKN